MYSPTSRAEPLADASYALCPSTSPNKTLEGALGAVVLTTVLAAGVGHFVFAGQPVDRLTHLLALGLIISVVGQFGDLLISSIIREPCAFILFPEGTRSRTGRMGPFKAGLGMIVAGSGVPIVPCRLHGAFQACPPDARLARPMPIRVRFGPALRFTDTPNKRQGWEQIATQTEQAVAALG